MRNKVKPSMTTHPRREYAMASNNIRIMFFTITALIAFAANSVLCRLALHTYQMDPSNFTIIRLLSGSLILAFIIIMQHRPTRKNLKQHGSWYAASMLFIYATSFSFAYITLDTATGALILFATVQICMLCIALFSGYRLHIQEWLGLSIALTGFVYLLLPELHEPSSHGFLLMTTAGIAWGVYSHFGRNSLEPLHDTSMNFIRTIPMVAIWAAFNLSHIQISPITVLLAVLSGGIASGMGYAIWYAALQGLSHTQAGVVQLTVPIIAAIGGLWFVAEPITLRITIAASLVLMGIFFISSPRAR